MKVRSHPEGARFDDAAFEKWLKDHPGGVYSQFSAEKVVSSLRKGTAHPTLGANIQSGAQWAEAGLPIFNELLALQPIPEDAKVCEYGCGSIRIGSHFIRRQPVRSYFGLDVTEDFISYGKALIEPELWAAKTPEVGTIGERIADAEAFGPDVVFATHVAIHVHPAEKRAFFDNLKRIARRPGAVVIFDALIARDPVRFRNSGWGWPIGFYLEGMSPLRLTHMRYRRDRDDVGQEFFFVFERPGEDLPDPR